MASNSTCLQTCFNDVIITNGCSGPTDLACICTSTTFQPLYGACIQTLCPDQLAAADASLSQFCSSTGVSSASMTLGSTTGSSTGIGSASTSSVTSLESSNSLNGGSTNQATTNLVPHTSSNNEGEIVGGVIGGVVLLIIVALAGIWLLRRARKSRTQTQTQTAQAPAAGTNEYTDNMNSDYLDHGMGEAEIGMRGVPWAQGVMSPDYQYPPIINTGNQSQFPQYSQTVSSMSTNDPVSRPFSPSSTMGLPPPYDASVTNPMFNPTARPTSVPSSAVYSDVIGQYASANRDVVTPDLENKLRQARYLPTDNPSDMSAEEWNSRHVVGTFELRRLQELYDRQKMGVKASKEVHSSGQAGAPWRPSS